MATCRQFIHSPINTEGTENRFDNQQYLLVNFENWHSTKGFFSSSFLSTIRQCILCSSVSGPSNNNNPRYPAHIKPDTQSKPDQMPSCQMNHYQILVQSLCARSPFKLQFSLHFTLLLLAIISFLPTVRPLNSSPPPPFFFCAVFGLYLHREVKNTCFGCLSHIYIKLYQVVIRAVLVTFWHVLQALSMVNAFISSDQVFLQKQF